MPSWHESQIADVGLKCNDMTTTTTIPVREVHRNHRWRNRRQQRHYYYVRHNILSEYVRARVMLCIIVATTTIETEYVCPGGNDLVSIVNFQTTQQYTWENVTMLVVVEDFNTWQHVWHGQSVVSMATTTMINHVDIKCCIEYGTIESWV
jgi:hypothetical protein